MPNPLSRSKTTTSYLLQFLIFSLAHLSVSWASAQVYNSSTSAATGGSGRASVEAGDVIYLNPATLPHLRGRHFISSFAKDEMAFGLSDNTPESSFPGAISYVQRKNLINNFVNPLANPPAQISTRNHDFAVTLANFVSEHFSMGVTGHYFSSTVDDAQQTSYRQTNADLGFAWVPQDNLGFGLVGYNFLGSKKDVPEDLRLQPTVGVGASYIYRSFVRYRFDLVSAPEYNFGKLSLMTGLESFITQFVVWRIGYQDESYLSRSLYTTGLGFNGPRFGINYAYQGNTKESADYRHSVDLQIPF